MPRYAQIDDHNICIAISDLSATVDHPLLIPIVDNTSTVMGQQWDGNNWQQPATQLTEE